MDFIKKLRAFPLIILFAVFIFGFFLLDLTATNRQFSELENRVLDQKPSFTMKSLVSNEYTLKYEEYINDQFIFRDAWISLKSISESALLKIENNGITYGADGYMFEKYNAVNQEQLLKNLGFVRDFLEAYPELPVTLAVIPNSYAILTEKLPAGFGNVPQLPLIDEMYASLDAPNLTELELAPVLLEHGMEYIYYRTDHHWTTLGAYYAYAAYARQRDLSPISPEEIAALAGSVEGFYGTYYSKAKLVGAEPDTIIWYDIPTAGVTIDGERVVRDSRNQWVDVEGLYNKAQFALRDKYAAFLYGNHGLTIIKSPVNRDAQEGRTSRVLVVKDSYGNSFAPFLCYNYDEVWVVDLRHIFRLSAVLGQAGEEFDDVLLLYNYMNFVQDTNLAKLRY